MTYRELGPKERIQKGDLFRYKSGGHLLSADNHAGSLAGSFDLYAYFRPTLPDPSHITLPPDDCAALLADRDRLNDILARLKESWASGTISKSQYEYFIGI